MSTELSTAVVPSGDDGSAPSPMTASSQVTSLDLSSRERAMLDFERQWRRRAGAKETAIRDLFELAPTRYYQALNALIYRPESLAADPMLVTRLPRLRASRQRARAARRLGVDSP